jgi:hypothetical protein
MMVMQPMKKILALLVVLLGVMLIASCVARKSPEAIERDAKAETRQCFAELSAKSVKFSKLPDQQFAGGCRTVDTIKLIDFGTPTTNLGAMTCPIASNFSAWAQFAVRPAAKQYFGSDIAKIETFGTYSCRNIGGGQTGRLSEHGLANAVDVSAFVLQNGRRITVLDGWNGRQDEREFLRRMHQSACRRFGTVLGPDYNAAHANHFHLDMAAGRRGGMSSYCR